MNIFVKSIHFMLAVIKLSWIYTIPLLFIIPCIRYYIGKKEDAFSVFFSVTFYMGIFMAFVISYLASLITIVFAKDRIPDGNCDDMIKFISSIHK